MKANTMAHILIVSDDETDQKITNYRKMLWTERRDTGYPE